MAKKKSKKKSSVKKEKVTKVEPMTMDPEVEVSMPPPTATHVDPPLSPKIDRESLNLPGAPDLKDIRASWPNKGEGVMVYKLMNNKKVFVPLKG